MKAEGSLSRDAGVLRGSRDGAGTPWVREGAWALRAPLGNTQPWPPWLQWPPQAPAMGHGLAHGSPGYPQVNAFCRHQVPEAGDAFTERGVGLWGTEVSAVTVASCVV